MTSELTKFGSDSRHLVTKVKNLEADLEQSEMSRRSLKKDITELNSKIIIIEEELYESKNIQLDLLEQIKMLE